MKLSLKSIRYILFLQLITAIFFIGCKSNAASKFADWPYQIEGIYGSKIFVHNPVDGLFIDVKEKRITKLFDSEKVNATRVQGSTLVISDISPNYKNVVFKFEGGDSDLIDKNKDEDRLEIYNIQSKKLKTLVNEGGYNASSCWSKDGSKYVFGSDRSDSVYIYDVKSDSSKKIERPKGKLGNITYIQDKYIFCVIDNSLYQYLDNNWSKLLDNCEGKVYSNSADDCYFIGKKEISKLMPKTKEVKVVYQIPADSKYVFVRNSKDMFVFLNKNQLHVFNTLSSKEILFKLENNLEDCPLCYISPKEDKVLLGSYDNHQITVASLESPKIYKYDNSGKLYFYPAGWYDNDSLVLIDGENVRKPKIFDLKTQKMKNLIGW